MAKFLRLTNFLLNANNINKISIMPNKYCIHFIGRQNDGFLWIVGGFGLGSVASSIEEVVVCETQHSDDYKIVTEWIKKMGNI